MLLFSYIEFVFHSYMQDAHFVLYFIRHISLLLLKRLIQHSERGIEIVFTYLLIT